MADVLVDYYADSQGRQVGAEPDQLPVVGIQNLKRLPANVCSGMHSCTAMNRPALLWTMLTVPHSGSGSSGH